MEFAGGKKEPLDEVVVSQQDHDEANELEPLKETKTVAAAAATQLSFARLYQAVCPNRG